MIKEQVEQRKVVQYYCDDCGGKLPFFHWCGACYKHLCRECTAHTDYDGDDSCYYCSDCWTLGKPYREKEEDLQAEILRLNDEWRTKCCDLRESKKGAEDGV